MWGLGAMDHVEVMGLKGQMGILGHKVFVVLLVLLGHLALVEPAQDQKGQMEIQDQ